MPDNKPDFDKRLQDATRKANKLFDPEKTEDELEKSRKNLKEYKKGSEAAIGFCVAVFLCTWIGKTLDEQFETAPLFLVIFLLLGVATGFYNLYKLIDKQ